MKIKTKKHGSRNYGKSFPFSQEERLKLRTVLFNAVRRCYDTLSRGYECYGQRGIRICPMWYDEKSNEMNLYDFYLWAKDAGYKIGLQLDRIDTDGDYKPSNCRWVTARENCQNKRTNHLITYKGETKCLQEWARTIGVDGTTLLERIQKGLPADEIMRKPVIPGVGGRKHFLTFKGKTMRISDWAEELSMPYERLVNRIARGWSLEEAFSCGIGRPSK